MKNFKDISSKDIANRLDCARKYIVQKRALFGPHVDQLVDEFMALNIDHSNEIWELIVELLGEITAKDRVGNDSLLNSESKSNCEMYSFEWNSKKLKRYMFIKFAIKNETFIYLSLREV